MEWRWYSDRLMKIHLVKSLVKICLVESIVKMAVRNTKRGHIWTTWAKVIHPLDLIQQKSFDHRYLQHRRHLQQTSFDRLDHRHQSQPSLMMIHRAKKGRMWTMQCLPRMRWNGLAMSHLYNPMWRGRSTVAGVWWRSKGISIAKSSNVRAALVY